MGLAIDVVQIFRIKHANTSEINMWPLNWRYDAMKSEKCQDRNWKENRLWSTFWVCTWPPILIRIACAIHISQWPQVHSITWHDVYKARLPSDRSIVVLSIWSNSLPSFILYIRVNGKDSWILPEWCIHVLKWIGLVYWPIAFVTFVNFLRSGTIYRPVVCCTFSCILR